MTLPNDKDNYFLLLQGDPRPHEIVPFPRKINGKEFNVAMVVLTAMESTLCKAEAERKAQALLKEAKNNSKGYELLYNDFCAVNILWNAVRWENDINQKFFPTKDNILEVLTVDEITILMDDYYSLLLHKGPVISQLSEEDLKVWMERIIKDGNSSSFLFNSFSSEALKSLINGLVGELKNLRTANSSSGGVPETTI